MTTSPHRKFIAAVAALSILITGFGAAQAQARDYSAERTIAALIGLAVIGSIVAGQSKAARKTDPVIRKPHGVQARPLPRDLAPRAFVPQGHGARKALPAQCLREARTHRGPARYFGARCLQKTYPFVNRLPVRCEQTIRTDRGLRQGWGARCLQRAGYTLARH